MVAAATSAMVPFQGAVDSHKGCRSPVEGAHPVFVVPGGSKQLWGDDQLCNFPSAHQMPPGASGGCRTTNLSRAALEDMFPAQSRDFGPGQLGRGPYCPSSQFWIAHSNDLELVLSSLELWADAFVANKWHSNVVRWESTTCSLLAPREAVLWLRFPWVYDNKPPAKWVKACLQRCAAPFDETEYYLAPDAQSSCSNGAPTR